jgi:hypothetical protein
VSAGEPGRCRAGRHRPCGLRARDRVRHGPVRTAAVPLTTVGVRLVAVGGLAVAIATGATVVQSLGGTDGNGRPRQVVPGLPAGPVANAQEALHKAADAAQHRSFTPPRPDQWAYVETKHRRLDKPGDGEVQTPRRSGGCGSTRRGPGRTGRRRPCSRTAGWWCRARRARCRSRITPVWRRSPRAGRAAGLRPRPADRR